MRWSKKMDWAVLHVKPRCEKKVDDFCATFQIGRYLPLRKETKIYQRRKVTVEKPVFPRYVFAAFGPPGAQVPLPVPATCEAIFMAIQGCLKSPEPIREPPHSP